MIPRKFRTYYEPFVGGGALLVKLYIMNMLNEAVISDLNTDLIDLYIL
ncbi:MAG: DNA adenine methylase [Thermoplasmata archaeon]